MNDFPAADYFDDLIVCPHEDDFTQWKVIGVRTEFNSLKMLDLVSNLANKHLAEAFVRVYTEDYIKEMFFGSRDC